MHLMVSMFDDDNIWLFAKKKKYEYLPGWLVLITHSPKNFIFFVHHHHHDHDDDGGGGGGMHVSAAFIYTIQTQSMLYLLSPSMPAFFFLVQLLLGAWFKCPNVSSFRVILTSVRSR